MLFHEIYGCYYHTVSRLLKLAVKGKLTEQRMLEVVRREAFGESAMVIPDALKQGRWQLIRNVWTDRSEAEGVGKKADSVDKKADRGYGTVLKHEPRLPITTLELRWLKAISLDARIRLFGVDFSALEQSSTIDWQGMKPLFTPEDFVVFDRYEDGDPFEEEEYIRTFQTIRKAIHTGRRICVEYHGAKGGRQMDGCRPYHIEYSEKDNKFRVYVKSNRRRYVMNIAKIRKCELLETAAASQSRENEQILQEEAVGLVRKQPLQGGRGKRHKERLVLELINERNCLERVMLHFAHFEKEAERLEDNRYRISIVYDKEDETELLIRVLSFGPFVKVAAPGRFVDLMKERLYRQKSCGLK